MALVDVFLDHALGLVLDVVGVVRDHKGPRHRKVPPLLRLPQPVELVGVLALAPFCPHKRVSPRDPHVFQHLPRELLILIPPLGFPASIPQLGPDCVHRRHAELGAVVHVHLRHIVGPELCEVQQSVRLQHLYSCIGAKNG